jgi:acetylornithine deacetylase/succinyl-diaminopimelate desuccinylase-like protein
VHSGDASGVVASSFRVLRQLLSRIEDETTGAILPADFHVEIPSERVEQAQRLKRILGESIYTKFPLHPGAAPAATDILQLILNRTWRPALSITGAAGLPPLDSAGNVLRPSTTLKLSLRLPPGRDAEAATTKLKAILESEPPYGARVNFTPDHVANGWNAPPTAPWLRDAIEEASQRYFGHEAAYMGEGGTIPFMAMLGECFPDAQFLVTGLLGPQSNAHGPNEFLHIPTAKKLTAAITDVLSTHALSEQSPM